MIQESQSYKDLKAHLREMFQLNQADLDFGIYRIMNHKRHEIENFLDKQLLPQVRQILENSQPNDKATIQAEITKLETTLSEAGIDPTTSPKIQDLKEKLNQGFDIQKLESEIYSDLYNFFRRYYSDGDFMSMRRYKDGVYAIPYSGEEVKLHWANHDQYYIKTSENFQNYAFKIKDNDNNTDKTFRFELISASTERNNNKAKNNKQRRFFLCEQTSITKTDDDGTEYQETILPITVTDSEVIIRFIYDFSDSKQEELNKAAEQMLQQNTQYGDALKPLWGLSPTDKDKNRTLFAKYMLDYTAKNSFDYFIHKDLGKFLRQELDFYIKNEIMHLDDIDNQTADYVTSYLSKIRAMRAVANKIITFLASLEDFQKKLWLKKKFVLESHYCITLNHIIASNKADELLSVIANNKAQIDEWVNLFAINDIKGDLGKTGFEALSVIASEAKQSSTNGQQPVIPDRVQSTRERESYDTTREKIVIASEHSERGNLGVDTKNISEIATSCLRTPRNDESLKNAIQFLRENDTLLVDTKFFCNAFKYRLLSLFDNLDEQTDGVLINSENFGALNLLQERYREKIKCIYIDPPYNTGEEDFIYKDSYQDSSWLSMIDNRLRLSRNLINQSARFFCSIDDRENSKLLELLFQNFGKENYLNAITWEKRTKSQNTQTAKYMLQSKIEYIHPFRFENKRQEFNLEVSGQKEYLEKDAMGEFRYHIVEQMSSDDIRGRQTMIYSILGVMPRSNMQWKVGQEYINMMLEKNQVILKDGKPCLIIRPVDEDQDKYKPFWSHFFDKETYGTAETGLNLLDKQMGFGKEFQTVKPIQLISKILFHASGKNDIILDYFAGSGTTGHAVINLNREDNGKRQYILTEMGKYFYQYTKPRIQKAVYSKDWKNGKPAFRDGVSQVIKYMSLEQYEDTLDNLGNPHTGIFNRTQAQQDAFDDAGRHDTQKRFYESYMLSYMLEFESQGSQSLLNIDGFANPFDYQLRVTRNNETQSVTVDLIETFNYLLGLTVQTIDHDKSGIITIKGINAMGENCMIIWRNILEINNDSLNAWFTKKQYSAKDFEFDAIYVNSDNNIENMKLDGDMWKVRLIEAEFKRLMFTATDV